MITMKQTVRALGPVLPMMLLAGCVSQGAYDALKTQNEQLSQQVNTQSAQIATDQARISRLQGAIKYTVNSDLLFPSGGWQMSSRGKQLIASFAQKLAPTQQDKLVVTGYTDNAPIGPALQQQGITSNQQLSEKRADNVMQFLISQGVQQDMISAQGMGEANPVASNNTPSGRAQNRRVELTLGTPPAG
jgi:chemotaxis protein MotB